MRRVLSVLLPLLGLFAAVPGAASPPDPLPAVQERLRAALQDMDRGLVHAAQGLAQEGLQGPRTREILARLCAERRQAIDCAAIDPQGVMVVVEPAPFKPFEGVSVANQPQVTQVMRQRQPVMSVYFYTAEGVGAVDIEHPVLGGQGDYLGSVSIIFDPARLRERLVADLALPAGAKLFLVQTDGRMLYSDEVAEIGRNLREDPLYAQNHEVSSAVERILNQEQGQTGPYQYRDVSGQVVRRVCRWTSLGLHGMTWRLGLAQPAP